MLKNIKRGLKLRNKLSKYFSSSLNSEQQSFESELSILESSLNEELRLASSEENVNKQELVNQNIESRKYLLNLIKRNFVWFERGMYSKVKSFVNEFSYIRNDELQDFISKFEKILKKMKSKNAERSGTADFSTTNDHFYRNYSIRLGKVGDIKEEDWGFYGRDIEIVKDMSYSFRKEIKSPESLSLGQLLFRGNMLLKAFETCSETPIEEKVKILKVMHVSINIAFEHIVNENIEISLVTLRTALTMKKINNMIKKLNPEEWETMEDGFLQRIGLPCLPILIQYFSLENEQYEILTSKKHAGSEWDTYEIIELGIIIGEEMAKHKIHFSEYKRLYINLIEFISRQEHISFELNNLIWKNLTRLKPITSEKTTAMKLFRLKDLNYIERVNFCYGIILADHFNIFAEVYDTLLMQLGNYHMFRPLIFGSFQDKHFGGLEENNKAMAILFDQMTKNKNINNLLTHYSQVFRILEFYLPILYSLNEPEYYLRLITAFMRCSELNSQFFQQLARKQHTNPFNMKNIKVTPKVISSVKMFMEQAIIVFSRKYIFQNYGINSERGMGLRRNDQFILTSISSSHKTPQFQIAIICLKLITGLKKNQDDFKLFQSMLRCLRHIRLENALRFQKNLSKDILQFTANMINQMIVMIPKIFEQDIMKFEERLELVSDIDSLALQYFSLAHAHLSHIENSPLSQKMIKLESKKKGKKKSSNNLEYDLRYLKETKKGQHPGDKSGQTIFGKVFVKDTILNENPMLKRISTTKDILGNNIQEFMQEMFTIVQQKMNPEETILFIAKSANLIQKVEMEKDENFKIFFLDNIKKLLQNLYDQMEIPLNNKKLEKKGVEAVYFPNMMTRRFEVLAQIPALLVGFDIQNLGQTEKDQLAQLLPYTIKRLSGREAVGSFLAINVMGMLTEELASLYLTVLSSMFSFHIDMTSVLSINTEEFPNDILQQILG